MIHITNILIHYVNNCSGKSSPQQIITSFFQQITFFSIWIWRQDIFTVLMHNSCDSQREQIWVLSFGQSQPDRLIDPCRYLFYPRRDLLSCNFNVLHCLIILNEICYSAVLIDLGRLQGFLDYPPYWCSILDQWSLLSPDSCKWILCGWIAFMSAEDPLIVFTYVVYKHLINI